uniref:Uncharacterized protein n=1 Tax=Ascaris lumbricoides TaxID=6252 RepID=A0A0M3HLZ2_ASCLU
MQCATRLAPRVLSRRSFALHIRSQVCYHKVKRVWFFSVPVKLLRPLLRSFLQTLPFIYVDAFLFGKFISSKYRY